MSKYFIFAMMFCVGLVAGAIVHAQDIAQATKEYKKDSTELYQHRIKMADESKRMIKLSTEERAKEIKLGASEVKLMKAKFETMKTDFAKNCPKGTSINEENTHDMVLSCSPPSNKKITVGPYWRVSNDFITKNLKVYSKENHDGFGRVDGQSVSTLAYGVQISSESRHAGLEYESGSPDHIESNFQSGRLLSQSVFQNKNDRVPRIELNRVWSIDLKSYRETLKFNYANPKYSIVKKYNHPTTNEDDDILADGSVTFLDKDNQILASVIVNDGGFGKAWCYSKKYPEYKEAYPVSELVRAGDDFSLSKCRSDELEARAEKAKAVHKPASSAPVEKDKFIDAGPAMQ